MLTKDLMIGNWVLDTRTNVPLRVNPFMAELEIPEWAPIPLSSKILEQNGFVGASSTWEKEHGIHNFYLGSKKEHAIFIEDSEFAINLYKGIFVYHNSVIYGICYVHQLQNAMAICNIDKEITL